MCLQFVCLYFLFCDVWVFALCFDVSCFFGWLGKGYFYSCGRPECVCVCLFVVPICSGFAGGSGCREMLDSVPGSIVVNPGAEVCGMVAAVVANDTWEWCSVVVPVIRDTWDADVLAIYVYMLLRKNLDSNDVG